MAVILLYPAKGMTVISPNTAKIFLLFGDHQGSAKDSGLYRVNPFYKSMTLSLRARNFESDQVKVNDRVG